MLPDERLRDLLQDSQDAVRPSPEFLDSLGADLLHERRARRSWLPRWSVPRPVMFAALAPAVLLIALVGAASLGSRLLPPGTIGGPPASLIPSDPCEAVFLAARDEPGGPDLRPHAAALVEACESLQAVRVLAGKYPMVIASADVETFVIETCRPYEPGQTLLCDEVRAVPGASPTCRGRFVAERDDHEAGTALDAEFLKALLRTCSSLQEIRDLAGTYPGLMDPADVDIWARNECLTVPELQALTLCNPSEGWPSFVPPPSGESACEEVFLQHPPGEIAGFAFQKSLIEACSSTDEIKLMAARHPGIIIADDVDAWVPEVCATTASVRSTPICEAASAALPTAS